MGCLKAPWSSWPDFLNPMMLGVLARNWGQTPAQILDDLPALHFNLIAYSEVTRWDDFVKDIDSIAMANSLGSMLRSKYGQNP